MSRGVWCGFCGCHFAVFSSGFLQEGPYRLPPLLGHKSLPYRANKREFCSIKSCWECLKYTVAALSFLGGTDVRNFKKEYGILSFFYPLPHTHVGLTSTLLWVLGTSLFVAGSKPWPAPQLLSRLRCITAFLSILLRISSL